MHRIPKNLSQIYSEQSVFGAKEAHPSSGNMRRSRSSSTLDSSPLAKRRRGDAGIDNRSKHGITTDMNSLTVEDSNSRFAEEFEATYPSYKGDWRLDDDFFPSKTLCDSESQERIEGRGENQSDSAGGTLADLPTAYMDDWLADEESEMSLEGESEANYAGVPVNDFQAVEENTDQQEKLKSAKRVRWTPEVKGIASNIVQANADGKLSGLKLYALLEEKCEAQKPELACPSYQSFRINFLGQSRESYVKWTPKSRKIAQELIQVNADRNLSGLKLYALLKARCKVQNPELACPSYDSFLETFLGKSRESYVKWTPKSRKIAQELIRANADRNLNGAGLYVLLKAKCEAQTPKLACPTYKSFQINFLEQSREAPVQWTPELKEMASNIVQANADRNLNGRKLYALLTEQCEAQDLELVCPSYSSFRENFLEKSRETPVQWTPELKESAQELIQANTDRNLNGRKLHALLQDWCKAQEPKLACPSYDSFRLKFLKQSSEPPVRWTDELKKIASNIVQANADPKLKGRKLYALLTAQCEAHDPELACPGYDSFKRKFLAKP